MDMQEVLKQIAQAQASKGGNYVRDGKYRYVLDRTVCRKGRKGTCVIPELRVVKAEKTDANVEPNPVGSAVSCVWNLSKSSAAAGNVKAFVLALLGLEEATTSEAKVQEYTAMLLADAQPFRGIEIDATTIRKMNEGKDNPANRGQMMTIPVFMHVAGQTEESIARNIAMLESTAAARPEPQPEPAPVSPAPQPVAPAPVSPATQPAAPAPGFLRGILK